MTPRTVPASAVSVGDTLHHRRTSASACMLTVTRISTGYGGVLIFAGDTFSVMGTTFAAAVMYEAHEWVAITERGEGQ